MFSYKKLKLVTTSTVMSFLILVSASYAANEYTVKSTDNLSGIVDKFYKDSKLSRHQIFIGLLAENPHAFRLGNINYLKSKQKLNIPNGEALLAMDKKDARNLVAEHNRHAKKRKKVQLDPPFENYTPKTSLTEGSNLASIAEKQQETSQELEKLSAETEALKERLKQLTADKVLMDEELRQLDELITQ